MTLILASWRAFTQQGRGHPLIAEWGLCHILGSDYKKLNKERKQKLKEYTENFVKNLQTPGLITVFLSKLIILNKQIGIELGKYTTEREIAD